MSTPQDAEERRLDQYPRPSVAVDTAVLTVHEGRLAVVLVDGERGRALPGTFVHLAERLRDAVLRSLQDKAGIRGLEPIQLHVFDDPARDDRGWVMSVAHLDVVAAHRLDPLREASLQPVDELPALPWDHAEIVARAVDQLRGEYRDRPDPRHLLVPPFTLRELQDLHEAVTGGSLPRDTFRRGMEPQLRPTGALSSGSVGKPARLFEVRP